MLKHLVLVFLRNIQIPKRKYLQNGHEIHTYLQKMHEGVVDAVPGRVALGLCHRVLSALSDLGGIAACFHPTWFCLSGLLLELLFPAFICPDYQHAEESCLVFT